MLRKERFCSFNSVLYVVFFLFCLTSVSAASISYTSPTSPSGSVIYVDYFDINVSVQDSNLSQIIYYWNGTNNSVYDPNLTLGMNFNNLSSLGENSTHFADISSNSYLFSSSSVPLIVSDFIGDNFVSVLNFTGSGQFINLSDEYNQSFSQLSVSFWFKTSMSNASRAHFIWRGGSSGTDAFGVWKPPSSDKIQFYVANRNIDSLTPVTDGVWHHFVGIWNSSVSFHVYVDGELDNFRTTTIPSSLTATNLDTIIGRRYDTSSYPYTGYLKDVFVWNRALTDSEARLLFFTSVQKFSPSSYGVFSELSGLELGTYYYQFFASNSSGYNYSTHLSNITLENQPPAVPEFNWFSLLLSLILGVGCILFVSSR